MSALTAPVPSYKGVPLKYISLVTLTVQNSALILIMHYSRVMPGFQTKRYFTSTAVLSNEILKMAICLYLVWREQQHKLGSQVSLATAVKTVFTKEAWKLTIPAALYTLQNNLQYVAVSNLDAATFQVTYQLKIITTAIFSVTLLGRKLSLRKWLSLFLLTGGIALVQLPTGDAASVKAAAAHLESGMNRQVGFIAVVCACTLSGLAGVYFEKVLKGSRNSLWSLNLQLSFFSLFPAFFIGVLWKDGAQVMQLGYFYGYNAVVWTAIIFQAAGGLIVALCVAYADNIMKNFATSVSILISCVASVWFFDFVITSNFIFGALIVLLATYIYGLPDAAPAKASPVNIADEEESVPLARTTIHDSPEKHMPRVDRTPTKMRTSSLDVEPVIRTRSREGSESPTGGGSGNTHRRPAHA